MTIICRFCGYLIKPPYSADTHYECSCGRTVFDTDINGDPVDIVEIRVEAEE